MNPSTQPKAGTSRFFITLALGYILLVPAAQAVSPPPDGGYPGGNTAEGQNTLLHLTTGGFNTAVGFLSLRSDATGNFNTAIGAGTLLANTADNNTATGAGALLANTTGVHNTADGVFALLTNTAGGDNTATGAFALQNNTTGDFNTAIGVDALFSNTTGSSNTVAGVDALFHNTTGGGNSAFGSGALASNTTAGGNSAVGYQVLLSNTTGVQNTAIGVSALSSNTTGQNNTAAGDFALQSNTGSSNTAVGGQALQNNTTGNNNTVLGFAAGLNVTTASNVICIGHTGANVDNSCYIGNIRGATTGANDAIPVVIDSLGQLGTTSSSRRFKKDIKPMDATSESILGLKPVTFHYKSDKTKKSEFGLIAEEVAELNPDLVVRDKDGEIYTVRYDAVNAMLLNEFLKEHRAFLEEQCKVERLEKQVAALTAGLQKVTAQLAMTNGAAGMRSDIDRPNREAAGSGSEQVNPSLADSR
jgi:hypothetical protein